jgi:tetratricopeptide (TPR) repeat protein
MEHNTIAIPEPTTRDESVLYAETLLLEAHFLLERAHYDEAEHVLGRALSLAPEHPGCLTNLAICLAKGRRRFVSAERLARRAIQLAPHDASGYDALGRVYHEAGRLHDARRYYQKARALAPDDGRIRLRLEALGRTGSRLVPWLPEKNPLNVSASSVEGFMRRGYRVALLTGMSLAFMVWLGLTFYSQSVVRRETDVLALQQRAHQVAAMASAVRQEVQFRQGNLSEGENVGQLH